MALKMIGFISVISLTYCMATLNQVKDVPFNVNEVINQVSPHQTLTPNPCPLIPEFTDEFMIDTSIVYVGAPNGQGSPVIAFDGTNYLVVWEDLRSGYSYDIYGTIVSQAGTVLDPTSIAISTAPNHQLSPAIAYDGTNYLVVWQDERRGSYQYDIYGAKVSQAGTVLDPTGFAISTAADNQWYPSIAFDGTNYLVVWEDWRSGDSSDIYGTRVTQTGTVLDPNGITISTAANYQEHPAITFDGTNYLIVWQDERSSSHDDIYGARVSQAGTVLDSTGIAISTAADNQWYPSIAFDGTNYLVVWQDERSGNYLDIYGTRVSQTGTVLDSNGIVVSTTSYDEPYPTVAFDGTNYLVVWGDERSSSYGDIYGARVSQAGTVLDSTGIAISTAADNQSYPALAFDGTNYLIVWEDERSNWYNDIYGARVSQAGTVLDSNGIALSTTINVQGASSVDFDGTNYLVVWQDKRNRLNQFDIYGARVSQLGTMLDSTAIAISTAANHQLSPALAFDRTNYLVVWQQTGDIYGARVSQAGIVLDPTGIAISTTVYDQKSPAIAFDGTNYLVVWEDLHSATYDIYGARVSQTGTVLDPDGIAISTAVNIQGSCSVAYDGTNYLVVWQDERNHLNQYDIYGAQVSQLGIVLDPDGIAISTVAFSQLSPAIAFDGTNYLVVWGDERSGNFLDIYGARISQAGTVLDSSGIVISTAANYQWYPAIVFDGTNYLVVWQDERNGPYPDIYGAKVSPTGALIDSFPVANQEGNQYLPALAHGSGNQVLITYEGWTGEYQGKTYNTMRIWGKFYPFIGIDEESSKVKMQSVKLLDVYPNPFSKQTAIRFAPYTSCIELKIYDITGKLVKSFFTSPQSLTPIPCLIWNGTDDSGKKLPAGVYLCRLKTAEGTTERKEIIIMR